MNTVLTAYQDLQSSDISDLQSSDISVSKTYHVISDISDISDFISDIKSSHRSGYRESV